MATTQLVIKNLKTEKEYTVSGEAWEEMVRKEISRRFTIVRQQRPVINAPSFIPPEIQNAARKRSEKEQPSGADASVKTTNNG